MKNKKALFLDFDGTIISPKSFMKIPAQPLFPEMKKILLECKKQKIMLFIITSNSPKLVLEQLKSAKISPSIFREICYVSPLPKFLEQKMVKEFKLKKKDLPKISEYCLAKAFKIKELLEKYKVEKKNGLVVGDTYWQEIYAARMLKMPHLLVGMEYRRPNNSFFTPEDQLFVKGPKKILKQISSRANARKQKWYKQKAFKKFLKKIF